MIACTHSRNLRNDRLIETLAILYDQTHHRGGFYLRFVQSKFHYATLNSCKNSLKHLGIPYHQYGYRRDRLQGRIYTLEETAFGPYLRWICDPRTIAY